MFKQNKRLFLLLFISIIVGAIFPLAQANPEITERVYSRGIFPFVGRSLNYLSSFLPFSFTDLTVALIPVVLLLGLWHGWRNSSVVKGLLNLVVLAGVFYSGFLLLWGFNYARVELQSTFRSKVPVTETQRAKILSDAAIITNQVQKKLLRAPEKCFDFAASLDELDKKVMEEQVDLFRKLGYEYFGSAPIKKRILSSLWLKLGNSGIYGPYTGETNLSYPLAPGITPFVIAHERAHLNGFASETDANLLGFLTMWSSTNPELQYSGWLNFWRHFPATVRKAAQVDIATERDLACIRDFWISHQSGMAKFVDFFYDGYLKAQGQKGGMKTYGESVTVLLQAFAERGMSADQSGYGLVFAGRAGSR